MVWCPQFRRGLEDWMVVEWFSLMDLLSRGFVVGSEDDIRFQDPDPHGIFSVKSFC